MTLQTVPPADSPPATAAELARMVAGIGALPGPPPEPLAVLPQMALARGRVHELTGPARRTLAALAAGRAQAEGPVVWLRPRWTVEGFHPQGLRALMPDPGALILARCGGAADVLWGLEEALRAGCVALAVAELPQPPDLRQVRRLHLAAAEGLARNRAAGRASPAPLGLICAHDTATSRIPGVESRWALHPLPPLPEPAPGAPGWRPGLLPEGAPGGWRLDRLLARGLPPADWVLRSLPPAAA